MMFDYNLTPLLHPVVAKWNTKISIDVETFFASQTSEIVLVKNALRNLFDRLQEVLLAHPSPQKVARQATQALGNIFSEETALVTSGNVGETGEEIIFLPQVEIIQAFCTEDFVFGELIQSYLIYRDSKAAVMQVLALHLSDIEKREGEKRDPAPTDFPNDHIESYILVKDLTKIIVVQETIMIILSQAPQTLFFFLEGAVFSPAKFTIQESVSTLAILVLIQVEPEEALLTLPLGMEQTIFCGNHLNVTLFRDRVQNKPTLALNTLRSYKVPATTLQIRPMLHTPPFKEHFSFPTALIPIDK